MMQITDTSLTYTHGRRVVTLEALELNYKVRALVQFQIDPEVARVFAFSGGARSQVIELAKRRRIVQ